ncbi:MAG: penicillin-binding protein activator [Pseudomonadota bacterium]
MVLGTAARVLRRIKPLVFALSALGLAACDEIPNTNLGNLNFGGRTVDIALLVPFGSEQAGDETIARDLENAARLAMADQPDAKLNITVYPTAGSASQAAVAAQKAVAEGNDVIIGPLYAEAANAAAVAAASKNVNVLAFSNNATIAGGNLFILGSTFDNTAERLLNYAQRTGQGSTLVVHGENLAGEVGRDAILQAAGRTGVRVAGVESYSFSEEGIRGAAGRISSSLGQTGAASIFLTAGPDADLPFLADRLPAVGISSATTQLIGLTRWDSAPQLLSFPGLDGGIFARPDPRLVGAFRNRYQGAYGASPHPLAGLAYDAVAAIGAMSQEGGRDALGVGALTRPNGFVGTSGIFRLLPSGTNQRGLAVAQVQNGQVVTLEQAPSTFAAAGF